jgi:hypothetical protein
MITPTESLPALPALAERERAALLAAYERIPASRRPVPAPNGGWSAAEIIEHCAVVEGGIARLIAKKGVAGPVETTPEQQAEARMTAAKIALLRDRSNALEAPERVRPTGTVDAVTALAQITQTREQLMAAIHGADPVQFDAAIAPHPFVGMLSLRAWVEMIAHHDARHTAQMLELPLG